LDTCVIEANDQVYTMMKAFFEENVPYAKHSGIELTEIADGRGAAKLPDWKETQNHMGSQHAGALFTLAEAASGAAMVSLFADKVLMVRAAITEATIRYKKAARGVVRATGLLRQPGQEILDEFNREGRVTFKVDVTLLDSKDREVAAMEVDWSIQINQPRV
jgi:uncharacterized protein (TIGR00369 family)